MKEVLFRHIPDEQRLFWQSCVIAAKIAPKTGIGFMENHEAYWADLMVAEWRKRFLEDESA